MQVVNTVSAALGESGDQVEAMLAGLLRAYPQAGPADWPSVEQVLSAQPTVAYDKVAPLLDALKELAAEAGAVEDPRVIIDNDEIRGYFAPRAQNAAADQSATTPVTDGSLIHRVGEAYYLGEGHQVWQATSGDSVYYHDGAHSYDALGQSLEAPEGARPAAGESGDLDAWYRYLAENGLRWDGAEASWQQFRDWFLYDAAEHGVGGDAQGFIALAERAADKRAIFAEYGLTLPTAAPSGANSTEDLVQLLRQEVMEPALAHVLSVDPEVAALGEDRLREILAEVTADQLAGRTG